MDINRPLRICRSCTAYNHHIGPGIAAPSGRLHSGESAVLLLISAKKAADGQQHKRCSSEIIDRQCNAPRAFRNQLPDGCRIQQNVNQKLRQQIIQCCAVCEAQGPAYQLHAKAITLEILYILFAKCGEIRTGTHLEGRESVSYERVDKILRYVDAHYGERIKLDDFAELLHINKYYICRIFRQHTGKTLSDYMNLVRIQKATELLISTSQSITEIAFVTGFQDINFFSRMFKRIMGISPTELRKRHRQKMQPASPQMAEMYKEE